MDICDHFEHSGELRIILGLCRIELVCVSVVVATICVKNAIVVGLKLNVYCETLVLTEDKLPLYTNG